MLIDWYTVGAQALNFIILVWLMKRYLYKPILHAIDAREKKIAAELADAAAKEAEASKEREEFQRKSEELEQQRAGLLKKATDDANAERQRLFSEARQAANALTMKRQETLRIDATNLTQAIQRRTQREVFAIARRVLTDLAETSVEERLVAVFTRRLRELDGPTKAGLAKALADASNSALLRSAFELPADRRAVIQNALNETFSADVHIRFETAPDLVGGIEVSASGQKVGWSIDGYLASLKKGIDDLLKEKEKEKAKDDKAKDDKAKDDKAKDVAAAKDDKTKDVVTAKDDKTKDVAAAKDDKAKDVAAAKDDKTKDVAAAKDDKTKDVVTAKDDKTKDVAAAKDDKTKDVVTAKDDKTKDVVTAKDDKTKDVVVEAKDDKAKATEKVEATDQKEPEGTVKPIPGAPKVEAKSQ